MNSVTTACIIPINNTLWFHWLLSNLKESPRVVTRPSPLVGGVWAWDYLPTVVSPSVTPHNQTLISTTFLVRLCTKLSCFSVTASNKKVGPGNKAMCFGYSNPYSHVHYRQIVCIKESKKLSENEKDFRDGPACSTSLKSKETRGNAFTNVESKGPSHLGTNHELYDRAGCRKQQSEICI